MKAKKITKGISVILAAVMLLAGLPCAFAAGNDLNFATGETGDISDLLGYKFTIAGTDCEPRVLSRTDDIPMSLEKPLPLDDETVNQILADWGDSDIYPENPVEYYGTLSDGSMLVNVTHPCATALNYLVMGRYVYATPNIGDEAVMYKDHKFERIITAYQNETISSELLDEIANILHFAVFDLTDEPIVTDPTKEETWPTQPTDFTVEPTESSSEIVEPMPEPIDPTGITVEPIEPSYAPSDPTVEPTDIVDPMPEPIEPSSDSDLEIMPEPIDDTEKGEYTLDFIMGDANSDGDVNVKDATLVQMYVVEAVSASEINLTAAKVCGGDTVTVKDATAIQMKAVGINVGW